MTRNTYDIAIIGGGVIGLTLARELLCEGALVCVIDAADALPGATNAAAGMLAPSFEHSSGEQASALYDFSAASLAQWPAFAREIEEESGISIDYRDDGILGIALDDEGAAALHKEFDALSERGANVEWLSGVEAQRLEPSLSPRTTGALYAKDDAQVDPRKLCDALRQSIERAGVRKNVEPLVTGEIIKVERNDTSWTLLSKAGTCISAGTLVFASGVAAGSLIDGSPRPPIFPVKGEALSLQMPGAPFRHVIRGPGAYLCPKADARLVIGATEHPHRDDLAPDPQAVAALKNSAAEIMPDLIAWPETDRWAGLRPATPDAAPIIGRDKRGPENLFLALGHHRNGVLLAPATAQALACVILGKQPESNLESFNPARFNSN